jgi:hypothetical protein
MSPSGDPLTDFHPGGVHPSSSAELSGPPQGSRKPEWLAVAITAFLFALYFGLAPLGEWQADEYEYFSRLRQGVGRAFATRLRWSPRPLGESVYLAYGLLANYFHRPLTGGFLGLLWVWFAVCACASACGKSRERRMSVLLLGLGLAAAFLTSGPLFQVFYWPAGAVAYLPTLSATLLLFVQILYGRQWFRHGRLVCCLCLLVAALSSEMGAVFTASFALLQMANALWLRRPTAEHDGESYVGYWLIPGIIACAVLLASALHRLPVSETAFTVASPQLDSPWASALAACRSLARELVGLDSNTRHRWLAFLGVLSRLLIAMGVALLWTGSRAGQQPKDEATRRQIIVIAAAFLIASLASLFASYLHFGSAAGERYETLRRCWILMTYAATAVLIVQSRRTSLASKRSVFRIGPVLLIAGMLLSWHVSPLIRQYSFYRNMACTAGKNFESGLETGAEPMVFVLHPTNGVITPAELAPGVYTRTTQASGFNYAGYMLDYFGKQRMLVRPNHPCDAGTIGQPAP